MQSELDKRYRYYFPTLIRFGKGVSDELGPHLRERGYLRPLLVSDLALTHLPIFEIVFELLKKSGLSPTIFSEISKNPIKGDVIRGGELFLKNQCDCVVGFGGGSSIDMARAIALRAHHKMDLFDYDHAMGGERYISNEVPYFVTLPSGSGTGSEVSSTAIIADDQTLEKKILQSPHLLAKKAFVDPTLSMALPASIAATLGMEALTHHIEAYLAKGYSPLCDGIALEGVRLIARNLELSVLQPTFESRAQMMMASLMGATASQKGFGVVRSMSHSLATVFDMHRGLASALMLTHGIEFNVSVSEERIENLCEAIRLKERSPRALIAWIEDLNRKIGIRLGLKSQGVSNEHLNRLADVAMGDPCHQANPRPLSRSDFYQIFQAAM
jgi:alcohol dehydrogenase class IV